MNKPYHWLYNPKGPRSLPSKVTAPYHRIYNRKGRRPASAGSFPLPPSKKIRPTIVPSRPFVGTTSEDGLYWPTSYWDDYIDDSKPMLSVTPAEKRRLSLYEKFDGPAIHGLPIHIVDIILKERPGNSDRFKFFFFHVMNGLHSPHRTQELFMILWPFMSHKKDHFKQMSKQYYSDHRMNLIYFDLVERRFLSTSTKPSTNVSSKKRDSYFANIPLGNYVPNKQ